MTAVVVVNPILGGANEATIKNNASDALNRVYFEMSRTIILDSMMTFYWFTDVSRIITFPENAADVKP